MALDLDRHMRFEVVVLAVASALIVASGAIAAGGTSVTRAPIIGLGAKTSANTLSDTTGRGTIGAPGSGCWIDFEYWRVSLTAGDAVLVKGSGYHFQVAVFPPGTNAKTIHTAPPVKSGFPAEAAMRFTARSTGTYSVVGGPNCYDGNDGAFDFVITAKHKTA